MQYTIFLHPLHFLNFFFRRDKESSAISTVSNFVYHFHCSLLGYFSGDPTLVTESWSSSPKRFVETFIVALDIVKACRQQSLISKVTSFRFYAAIFFFLLQFSSPLPFPWFLHCRQVLLFKSFSTISESWFSHIFLTSVFIPNELIFVNLLNKILSL